MASPRSSKNASLSAPLAKKFLAVGLAIFCGYLVADVGVLYARKYMLPNQPPPAKPRPAARRQDSANYYSVVTRNIFNADGVIPEPLVAKGGNREQELPPILSQLPLTLTGTLVHSNPDKSLAALEIKGKNQILSFRPKQAIENMATLEKVERMKIFIRNSSTGRMEFLEMKSAPKMNLRTAAAPAGKGDVKKVSETEFELKRSDLMKHTSDLSSILMQARAVPARRGGNGEIYGYRIVEMQPNSIYTQLGLQTMDVITGVNGTPVTNPQQAMEMYQTLRNSPQIKIQVERGGRNQEMNYRITN